MRRLFICERPFPLYRSIIKAVSDPCNDDIIISNQVEGMEKIVTELRNSVIFNNVYFFDDVLYKEFDNYGSVRAYKKFPKNIIVLWKKLCKYIEFQNKAKSIQLPDGIDINSYDEIYVNDVTSSLMFYLFSKKKKVIWMEHAVDGYQIKLATVLNVCYRLMHFLEKIGITYALHGVSKYVDQVEVNRNEKLVPLIKNKKIKETNIGEMISRMSSEKRNSIFEIYQKAYDINFDELKTVSIVLTAPLYVDNCVKSEKEQICVYTNMINECVGTFENVLIKPHPRDSLNYAEVFPKCTVIDKCVSAEVINLSTKMEIDNAIGIRTTTVAQFTKAKKKNSFDLSELNKFM